MPEGAKPAYMKASLSWRRTESRKNLRWITIRIVPGHLSIRGTILKEKDMNRLFTIFSMIDLNTGEDITDDVLTV